MKSNRAYLFERMLESFSDSSIEDLKKEIKYYDENDCYHDDSFLADAIDFVRKDIPDFNVEAMKILLKDR